MSGRIEAIKPNIQEMARNYIPNLGRANIAFFYQIYRGKDLPIHQWKWLNFLDDANFKYFLKLAPRDHGKTEVFSITYPLHRIINNRDVRVLLISKSASQVIKNVGVIKNELSYNPKIKEDFGDFVGDPWTDRYFNVLGRNPTIKDYTVEGVGVGGAITGGHFDLIVADDICDDENVGTRSRRDKTFDWFHGTVLQLAEPHTKIIVVGTRKHFDDLYSRLMENPLWIVGPESAIIEYPHNYEYIKDENGQVIDVEIEGNYKVLWAEKWDIKTLLLDKLATGTILFNREKQNDPSSMRGNFLKLEWLHFFDEAPPLDEMKIYQGVDLAISKDETADWTVIATIGVDKHNKVWLLDIYRARLDFPEAGRAIQELANIWKPISINIESNAYQVAQAQNLMLTTTLPVRESRSTKDKAMRIIAMSANFENERIRVKRGLDDFIKEWLEFPNGKYDDTLDGVEKALEVPLGYGEFQIF